MARNRKTRDEYYVIHAETGRRVAVPVDQYERFKAEGYVIDPDGPSAGKVPYQAVSAARKRITREREEAAETDGGSS